MSRLDSFKPNRTIDLDARISAIENWASRLTPQLAGLVRMTSTETLTETLAELDSGGGAGGGTGGSFSGDATSILGEPISDDPAAVDGDILTYDGTAEEWDIRQYINGNLGIGTGANATARLQLAAGTAAASTAPAKLTSGTNLTTPEAGAVEFDGFRLEFTPTSVRKFAGLSSAHITASAAHSNSATESAALFTGSIPANSVAVGQSYVMHLYGRYSAANGTDIWSLRLKIAGATLFTAVSSPIAVTDEPWYARLMFTVRSLGATGTIWTFLECATYAAEIALQTASATTTVDTTAALNVTATVQWSAADVGDVFSLDQAWLEALG